MPAPWTLAHRVARLVRVRGYVHRDDIPGVLGMVVSDRDLHSASW